MTAMGCKGCRGSDLKAGASTVSQASVHVYGCASGVCAGESCMSQPSQREITEGQALGLLVQRRRVGGCGAGVSGSILKCLRCHAPLQASGTSFCAAMSSTWRWQLLLVPASPPL